VTKPGLKLIAILFITSSFFHSNALAMSCVELVGMIVPKPKVEATVKDSNGHVYRVRAAIPEDIPAVTLLIRNAFEIWKREGLSLSPMTQTDLQTARHLVDKGFVAENSAGELVGTFSLDKGSISRDASGSIQFIEGDHQPISFSAYDSISIASSERLLVFKKAAVRLDLANSGLGKQLYRLAETIGRENGFDGMVLETVKEARWLYEWYVKLGFQPIGSHRYPSSQIDTVLMIKRFDRDLK
jgi:predicted N-acetyltransferase YhbS